MTIWQRGKGTKSLFMLTCYHGSRSLLISLNARMFFKSNHATKLPFTQLMHVLIFAASWFLLDKSGSKVNNVLLTRGVFLVLLQDPQPPVDAVIRHRRSVVPPGAVVVYDPLSLPLQRGGAGLVSRRARSGKAEDRRPNGGQEHEKQSVHVDYKTRQSTVISRQNRLYCTCFCCCCTVSSDRKHFPGQISKQDSSSTVILKLYK